MMQTIDFFRARLDVMIDLRHPLAVLATRLPWSRLEAELAPIWRRESRDGVLPEGEDLFGSGGVLVAAGVSYAGRSRLPLRLMCSLLYLKHAFNLSDEETCDRWAENVVWQYFSGMDYYEPRPPCDATQIGRFRSAIGETGMQVILRATIDTALASKAIKPAEFERIIVDSTVQEKAIAYPVDSRLLEIARHKIVVHAKRCGIALRQSFAKEGKALKRKAGGYAHAKQFKRLNRTIKRQRTIVGKLIRAVRSRLSTGFGEQWNRYGNLPISVPLLPRPHCLACRWRRFGGHDRSVGKQMFPDRSTPACGQLQTVKRRFNPISDRPVRASNR